MNGTDELLQRCFDNDLSDDELRTLFGELHRSGTLRGSFTSFVAMRSAFSRARPAAAPVSLDERIARLTSRVTPKAREERTSLRLILTRRLQVTTAAAAAAAIVMMIGGFLAGKGMSARSVEKEYYYVSELPAYVVQSSINEVRNN